MSFDLNSDFSAWELRTFPFRAQTVLGPSVLRNSPELESAPSPSELLRSSNTPAPIVHKILKSQTPVDQSAKPLLEDLIPCSPRNTCHLKRVPQRPSALENCSRPEVTTATVRHRSIKPNVAMTPSMERRALK